MTETTSELLPKSLTVRFDGEDITIHRISIEQILQLVDVLFSVYQKLVQSGGTMTLTGLFAAMPDAVFRILAVTTDKPESFYRTTPDKRKDAIEFLDVLEAWWDVNGDFFVNRLVPRLQQMVARLSEKASS